MQTMTTAEFFKMRVEAEITSCEIADYAGCTRKLMLMVETGKAPVEAWMVAVLREMIAKR